MRDIRFRGWDGEQWLYGDLLTVKENDPHTYIRYTDSEGDTLARTVDPKSICQYTGFSDRQGKELYEGDIIQTFRGKGTIEWEEGRFWFECTDKWPYSIIAHQVDSGEYDISADHSKYIGNLFENNRLTNTNQEKE